MAILPKIIEEVKRNKVIASQEVIPSSVGPFGTKLSVTGDSDDLSSLDCAKITLTARTDSLNYIGTVYLNGPASTGDESVEIKLITPDGGKTLVGKSFIGLQLLWTEVEEIEGVDVESTKIYWTIDPTEIPAEPFTISYISGESPTYSVSAGRLFTKADGPLDVAAVSDVAISETRFIYVPVTINDDGTAVAGVITDDAVMPTYWDTGTAGNIVINLVIGKVTIEAVPDSDPTSYTAEVEWNTTGDRDLYDVPHRVYDPFTITVNEANQTFSVTGGRVFHAGDSAVSIASSSGVSLSATTWVYVEVRLSLNGTVTASGKIGTSEPTYYTTDAGDLVYNIIIGKISLSGTAVSIDYNNTGDINLFNRMGHSVAVSYGNEPVSLEEAFSDVDETTYISSEHILVWMSALEGEPPGQTLRMYVKKDDLLTYLKGLSTLAGTPAYGLGKDSEGNIGWRAAEEVASVSGGDGDVT